MPAASKAPGDQDWWDRPHSPPPEEAERVVPPSVPKALAQVQRPQPPQVSYQRPLALLDPNQLPPPQPSRTNQLPPTQPVRKVEKEAPFMDLAWLIRNVQFPNKAEYPDLAGIFGEPSDAMQKLFSWFGLDVIHEIKTVRGTSQCRAKATLSDGSLRVWGFGDALGDGKGGGQKTAKLNAYRHIISKLHTSGTLHRIQEMRKIKNGGGSKVSTAISKPDTNMAAPTAPANTKAEKASKANKSVSAPARPILLQLNPHMLRSIDSTLGHLARARLPTSVAEPKAEDQEPASRRHRHQRALTESELRVKSRTLQNRLITFTDDPRYADMRTKKDALPISQYASSVWRLVDAHSFSIIVGATGSGKTTQVPQILLEKAIHEMRGASCNIVCTQPRRIAATSVAQRVASERAESLGKTVGYHVRGDSILPERGGSITYCTTGILLQQLQGSPDQTLNRVSHIVIDEVHERDILIDFLMIFLKFAARSHHRQGREMPRVVLMSATINSEMLEKYFQEKLPNGTIMKCPTLDVPGRTFPVSNIFLADILTQLKKRWVGLQPFLLADQDTKKYLDKEFRNAAAVPGGNVTQPGAVEEDTEQEESLVPINLVAATIMLICKTTTDGAILVFLPGFDEMKTTQERLQKLTTFDFNAMDSSKYRLYLLHSSIPQSEQSRVFDKVPAGCQKIILATNIAETSITIPDVQYVVDAGKMREKRYDQLKSITRLQCTWVSQSNAKQRAGRAGRVQGGACFKLYTQNRHDSLRTIGLPEMLRSDLQDIALSVKAQNLDFPIAQFLAEAIEPPPPSAVNVAISNLKALQALNENEDLTPLGRVLASLPLHPTLGRMVLLGAIFRCLDTMIVLAACLSERSIFVSPFDKRVEADAAHDQFLEGTESDLLAISNAFNDTRTKLIRNGLTAAKSFANTNFLHWGSFQTANSTAKQIETLLVQMNVIQPVSERDRDKGQYGHPDFNTNSRRIPLVKAVILAGMHSNLALATSPQILRTSGEKATMIHPSSLNRTRGSSGQKLEPDQLFTYASMSKSSDGKSLFLRETSTCTPLAAALFGGALARAGGMVNVGGWLQLLVKGSAAGAETVQRLRKALDVVLSHAFREVGADGYLGDDRIGEVLAEGLDEVLRLEDRM